MLPKEVMVSFKADIGRNFQVIYTELEMGI